MSLALEPTILKDLLTKSSVFLAKGEEENVLLILAYTKWRHGVSAAKNFSNPNEIPLAFIPFPDAVWTTVDTAVQGVIVLLEYCGAMGCNIKAIILGLRKR